MVGHEIGHDQTDREINFIQFLLFLNQIRNVVRNGIQELLFALYFSICCADSNNPHEEPVAVHNCGGLFYYNMLTSGVRNCTPSRLILARLTGKCERRGTDKRDSVGIAHLLVVNQINILWSQD